MYLAFKTNVAEMKNGRAALMLGRHVRIQWLLSDSVHGGLEHAIFDFTTPGVRITKADHVDGGADGPI